MAMVPGQKATWLGILGQFSSRLMLFIPPFVVAPVNRCWLRLDGLGGETGHCHRGPTPFQLLGMVCMFCPAGSHQGRKGWLCVPAAPCAGRVGAALQAGLLKSVENGKKSVQKSSSKEHHGSAERGIMPCDHTGCFPREKS